MRLLNEIYWFDSTNNCGTVVRHRQGSGKLISRAIGDEGILPPSFRRVVALLPAVEVGVEIDLCSFRRSRETENPDEGLTSFSTVYFRAVAWIMAKVPHANRQQGK